MNYQLQTNNDLVSGTSVTVMIPEDELDAKALYTIEATAPDFILPFHYRVMDGQVELVYMIGQHSKLQYFSGDRSAKEYSELWHSVLNPLLDCSDWFLRPYCFVVGSEYLYYNKDKNAVSYIYIPSKHECSDFDALREMAIDVSSLISVVNVDIENKALRLIMKNFDPRNFLQMMKPYMTATAPVVSKQTLNEITSASSAMPAAPLQVREEASISERLPNVSSTQYGKTVHSASDDIVINLPPTSKNGKKQSGKHSDTGSYESFYEYDGVSKKDTVKSKVASKLFNKKKTMQIEDTNPTPYSKTNESVSSFSTASISNSLMSDASISAPSVSVSSVSASSISASTHESDDTTQISESEISGARLRFVGTLELPSVIAISIGVGEIFTIGRFDSTVGKSQSSFEFDKKTKGVSRRHAAIERSSDRYTIIDLSSSAGTYVDRKKIPPNTPYELESGSRVSFGSTGANYVWEI